jgi:predicted outer membrane repeat protein
VLGKGGAILLEADPTVWGSGSMTSSNPSASTAAAWSSHTHTTTAAADYCQARVVDTVFEANVAHGVEASGGAVYTTSSAVAFVGCNFSNNSAVSGGAICSDDDAIVRVNR